MTNSANVADWELRRIRIFTLDEVDLLHPSVRQKVDCVVVRGPYNAVSEMEWREKPETAAS